MYLKILFKKMYLTYIIITRKVSSIPYKALKYVMKPFNVFSIF